MAIKINGVTITSNKLNGSDVLTEKLNGTVVYSKTVTLQWQFVGEYSSEPYYYDFYTEQFIYGDYEQGLNWLHLNIQEDLNEGFVAVIGDKSTYNNFEYVTVLV